ncbi:nucleotidyltransferase domain-containing protein [Agrobacterium vaccinii]|uniref:nucleotidyltransferase family protein n=1 Tax=Agrobacterium vaccinii TaxID=2735528 RepID=UPI001E4123F7|nr:nucleotidyltransferase domain-containing protein [Agrobacterium vaccinii]UHS60856.1 nucleotidyltransferase domain-containing protein [Agrobacterium vaccinii]
MEKAVALEMLRQRTDAVKGMGATALYIFGSTARDEASVASDLDVYIDYDPASKFSLLDLVGIKQFLEEELEIPVDLTTRNSLHTLLRTDIEHSAIRVF